MKVQHINEAFTVEEMRALRSVKGTRTWRDAILEEFGVGRRGRGGRGVSVDSGRADGEAVAVMSGWRVNAVAGSGVQSVRYEGREYLRFSITPLVEMVYEYPERGTKEYLPREHIAETASLWDGTPLTFVHPKNRERSVRDPDAWATNAIGAVHNPEMVDGKLRVDGILDVKKAEDVGGHAAALVDDLRAGRTVQVSAGYGTVDDETQSGRFDGDEYDLTQSPPLPDHVAVFPNDSDAVARCSPEDGCAAPRANATESQISENEREETRMSETESAVDTAEEQRQMTDELSSTLAEMESSGVATDAQTEKLRRLRNVTDGLGQMLERGETDVSPALGPVVRESKALVADILNENETDEKTNAACDCAGVCRCNPSTSGSDGTGESLPNMTAAPGRMNRDVEPSRGRQREDPEAYPAGGRKAWERRQVGLSDVPDDDEEYPAGGRSNWEARNQRARTNAEQSAAETPTSAAARRSLSRQNASGVEPSKWAVAEYPLMAKRHAQKREEKRQRWNHLREQAKRNDTNTVKRRNSSGGSQ